MQWVGGMRALSIILPLGAAETHSPLWLKVGCEPKSTYDEYNGLSDDESRPGVISAWSAPFVPAQEAAKLVERRFMLPRGPQVSIWEETGESIARHLW